jgi:hypothetical protein
MTRLAQGKGHLIEYGFYTNAEKGLPWDELFNSHGKYVFHYTTLDTALQHILYGGRLRVGPYANTNDPRESKDWEFTWVTDIPSRVRDPKWAALGDRANSIGKRFCRVLCTTEDAEELPNAQSHFGRGYCHPRMWAQYAGGHSGVCLVFDKALLHAALAEALSSLGELFFGKVLYADHTKEDLQAYRLDHKKIRRDGLDAVMRQKLAKFHQTYFFQKALDWKHEYEYRWVLLGNKSTPEFIYVDTFLSLKYIILGMDCAEAYHPSLTFIGEERAIPIGRLIWINGQPYFRGSISPVSLKAAYRSPANKGGPL